MTGLREAGLACLAFCLAEIVWTFSTGFASAGEGAWILAAWALFAVSLSVAGLALPQPHGSSMRSRAFLLAPCILLALRGEQGLRGGLDTPLNLIVLLALFGFVLLSTRRETPLNRYWFLALLCAAAATTSLAFRSIVPGTQKAVQSVHPERFSEAVLVACLVLGCALLAAGLGRDWRAGRFALLCVVPSLAITGAFVWRASVRPPMPPTTIMTQPSRPSVVILVLDTLRRDGLSSLGGPAGLTPNLDRFASASTLFTNAYSNGTYSLTGHGSLFSGLLPSDHGAHPPNLPVRDSVGLLGEELRGKGYATYGYSANPVYLAPWTGLQRGFTGFYSEGRDRFGYYATSGPLFGRLRIRPSGEQFWWPADDFIKAVLPIISTQGTALFLNLMESHGPWPEEKRDDRSAYMATVQRLDRTLEDLLNALAAQPNAITIITSDHGAFLGEHGLRTHATGQLYEAGIQIPLIVRFPGQRTGSIDRRRVSLLDVLPMVRAGLSGVRDSQQVPIPDEPRVIAETWTPRAATGAGLPNGALAARAVYLGQHKLIEHQDGFEEIFDLASDPQEQINLAQKDPAFARAFVSVIRRSLPAMSGGAEKRPSAEVPPDVLERMRSLGYIK